MLKHKEGMDSIPNIHDADQSNVRQVKKRKQQNRKQNKLCKTEDRMKG